MKVLFVTSRLPYPLDKGDKLRAYHQIKCLSEEHEIHLVSIIDQDPKRIWLDELATMTKTMHIIRISPTERAISVINALYKGLPFQTAWFYNKNIHNKILDIYYSVNPDHCYCQLLRMAEYIKDLPGPKTLDYMDAFGASMHRRSKIAPFLSGLFYRFEASRMIKYETKIADYFDNLIIISQQDKSLFDVNTSNKMVVVGNGISEYFTEYNADGVLKEYDLVFSGNMSYLPNIETVKFIVNDVLPLLPDHYTLLIAGTNPAKEVWKLVSDRVKVTGWVDDIRSYYAKGKIFIAPMWSGTGQQNKILEALAIGIPCITTQEVNNAIGAKPDHEIMIAFNKNEFAEKILRLGSDDQLHSNLVTFGKRFVKEKYSWKQKAQLISSIFAQN